jgi:hypothetical protein
MSNYIYVDSNKFTINCSVCNNFDYLRFDYDAQCNQCICMECGAILPNMGFTDLVACSTMEPANNTTVEQYGTVNTTTPTKPWKDTYNKRAYIMERLSAACMREPDINKEDKDKIRTEYELYSEQSWIHQQRKQRRYLNKKIFKTYSNL